MVKQTAVTDFFNKEKPEVVIDAAARVGVIIAKNDYPYNFLMENLIIQNNLIDNALKTLVDKIYIPWLFLYLSKICISILNRRIFTN